MIDYKKLNKILICRLSSLGDILLVTPVIDEIKKQNPQVQIDFMIKEKFVESIYYNPNIENIIKYQDYSFTKLRKKISSENYDLILDFQNNLRTQLIFSLIRTRKKSIRKPTLKKLLLVKFKINLLQENFSIPNLYATTAEVKLSNESRLSFYDESGRLTRNDEKKNIIGFCPGARHFTKIWPESYFADLGKLLNQSGLKVYLFGGKMEREICRRLQSQIPNSIDYSTENDLYQTARQMKSCDLIVTNDSALMHLASAINIPIVAIFGSSVKNFGFTPFNVKNIIVENSDLKCRPCSHIGRKVCPQKHFKCMLNIKPNSVFDEVLRILKSYE